MVEVVVVVAVIGVLLAILLPAVQHVRSSAESVDCRNRLRQFGVALQQHHDVHKRFPGLSDHGFSAFVELLPYMEQQPLYDSLEINGGQMDGQNYDILVESQLSIVKCPANPYSTQSAHGDFALSSGIGFPALESGLFRLKPVRAADVTDGLSNTAAMSEVVSGFDYVHELNDPATLPDSATFQRFADTCNRVPRETARGRLFVGNTWFVPGIPASHYTHATQPGTSSCRATRTSLHASIVAARSQHVGNGVNVLFADGHCRFVSNDISLETWQSTGTIAGREVVTF